MKKIMLTLASLASFAIATAQNNYKKAPTFVGPQFVLNDFTTASALRQGGMAQVIRENTWKKIRGKAIGTALSYMEGLSNHVDFAATLSGAYLEYPVPNRVIEPGQSLLLELAATANLKLMTDNYFASPFLTLGVGASKYRGYYSAFIPAGLGLQFKVVPDFFIIVNSQYRIPVTDNGEYHLYHSLGLAQSFGKPKPVVVPPPPVPVILDRDNDGVPDATDKCPDTPGLANLMGCPDKDGDGIADADDKCADVAGIAKYGGCPIPDTDGDGINDENDKCPTVKGVARYQGCPVPDQDNDGVNDEDDKCPTSAGPASNQGCPEISNDVLNQINNAAKNIVFATGSYKILPKSYKSLDVVAELMKQDESLTIDIDGHTDDAGADASNQILSERRATSVKEYLKGKGVAESRMASTGYGEAKPVGDNKTVAGRAQNRRIEITAKNQ